MTIYILAGLCLFLLLLCAVGYNAIRRAIAEQDHAKKHRHYLQKALIECGIWQEYQSAEKLSWKLWSEAEASAADQERNEKCRECNALLPKESIQGSDWHRMCAECYKKRSLPTDVSDAKEIAVRVEGKSLGWLRVFPHVHNGQLALRIMPSMYNYLLMPNGDIKLRPRDFELPEGMPSDRAEEIERSFILTDPERVARAKRAFEAYEKNDFEVID